MEKLLGRFRWRSSASSFQEPDFALRFLEYKSGDASFKCIWKCYLVFSVRKQTTNSIFRSMFLMYLQICGRENLIKMNGKWRPSLYKTNLVRKSLVVSEPSNELQVFSGNWSISGTLQGLQVSSGMFLGYFRVPVVTLEAFQGHLKKF